MADPVRTISEALVSNLDEILGHVLVGGLPTGPKRMLMTQITGRIGAAEAVSAEQEEDIVALEANVVALQSVALSVGDGFYAHKNGVNQTGMPTAAYQKVTFGTEKFDVGGLFDTTNSRWTPPAGLVQLNTSLYWVAHAKATASPVFTVKIIKNGGADVAAGIGTPVVGFPGIAIAHVSCVDQATGTDYYEVYAYATSDTPANDLAIDGNMAHTHFSGHVVIQNPGVDQAWTAYTPAVVPGTGALTTVSATGAFKIIGKTVFVRAEIVLTTNGTGAVSIIMTLPPGVSPKINGGFGGAGYETAATGKMLQVSVFQTGTPFAVLTFYDATYPGGNGRTFEVGLVFEMT